MSAGARSRGARRIAADAAQRVPVLVDLYRMVRNPRWEFDVRRDLARTRRQTSFLRELAEPPYDAPVVLLGLYRDDIYETKLGLLLASRLRLEGYRVVVLIPSRRAWRAARYAAAFGITDIVDLEGVELSRADLEQRAVAIEAFESVGTEFSDVADLEVGGRQVGVHLLSTLIRVTFEGDPDLTDPSVGQLARSIMEDLADNYVRLCRVLDLVAPDVALVEESNYSQNGPLVDLCTDRGIDVVRTIAIWREDALMSRRITTANRRVDAKSVARETFVASSDEAMTDDEEYELWRDFGLRYGGGWDLGKIFQPDTIEQSPSEIIQALGLDPDRPTAVVFAHVLWDASLAYGEDLFRNHADWLVETTRAAVANPALNWLVKAHPSNVYRAAHGDVSPESREVALLREEFGTLPAHVHVIEPETPISTRSLYAFADVGLTVRGTPGLEMACVGKPVLTAGTGHYSGLGFTVDSTSAAEYLTRCGALPDVQVPGEDAVDRARRYAHLLFVRRPWVTESFRTTYGIQSNGWHPLYRNVDLLARSAGELRQGLDLEPWARWVTSSREADYLAGPASSVEAERVSRP